MTVQCWRCARCRALTRTWRGFMRFRQYRGQYRPTCWDEKACFGRSEAASDEEVWIDEVDQPAEVGDEEEDA